jgi:hypothetical protein
VLLAHDAACLAEERRGSFFHGRSWRQEDQVRGELRAYDLPGRFLGLVRTSPEEGRWQPALSFVYDADAAAG